MSPRPATIVQADIERIYFGSIFVEPVDAPCQAIVLQDDKWIAFNDHGRGVVRVTRPLFDKIPKVHIAQDSAPDPDDLWADALDAHELGPANSESVYAGIGMRTGLVKIGYSSNLDGRRRVYYTESAEPIDFFYMPGGRDVESALHRHFAALRVNKNREWFYPHPSLLAYMMQMG